MRESVASRSTDMPGDILVEVRGLHKSFGDLEVLKGIDLTIRRGDVAVIVGPSGCGKSTLLRCLNFLELPTAGEILFGGERVENTPSHLTRVRSRMGMVFQRFHLFPHMTVLDNLLLAPRVVKGEGDGSARPRALELLAKVGLSDKADVHPDRLSGGQQQRVAIARCLMMEPELLLFDEPTSALDPELVGEVLQVMKLLAAEGRTMAVVTHEMDFARQVGSHIVMLDAGTIVEEGTPDKVLGHPEHPRTRQFLRRLLERV